MAEDEAIGTGPSAVFSYGELKSPHSNKSLETASLIELSSKKEQKHCISLGLNSSTTLTSCHPSTALRTRTPTPNPTTKMPTSVARIASKGKISLVDPAINLYREYQNKKATAEQKRREEEEINFRLVNQHNMQRIRKWINSLPDSKSGYEPMNSKVRK